jgi:hypothetical protein
VDGPEMLQGRSGRLQPWDRPPTETGKTDRRRRISVVGSCRIGALQQFFERGGEMVGKLPRVGEQIRARKNADTEGTVESP